MSGRGRFHRWSTAVSAAVWLGACAVGVGDEVAPPWDGAIPAAPDAAAPDADAAPAVLPPWLTDPQFDTGTQTPSVDLDAAGVDPPSGIADAGRPLDASRPQTPPRTSDAGSTRPTGGSTGTGTTRCQASTCTNECSLAGPLRCCTDRGSCGCTWAPGAYCL
jgi:hypothetical protein